MSAKLVFLWRPIFHKSNSNIYQRGIIPAKPGPKFLRPSLLGERFLLGDIRIAFRAMRRRPSFAAATILILGVGIGSSTALFSIVYALLLNPLPFPQSRQIVWLWSTAPQQISGDFSRLDYADILERNRVFDSLAWLNFDFFQARLGGEPERIQGMVGPSSFSAVMRTSALLGRTFVPADDAGNPRAVLLSYRLWQERFKGDRGVIGQSLLMNGENFAIVGVMPPEFRFPSWAEIWVTARPRTANALQSQNRSQRFFTLLARIRPHLTPAQASEDLHRIYADLARAGQTPKGTSARAVELRERLVGNYRPVVFVLLGASVLLLVIACSSVANLFLARALARQRDWSLRVAMGARLPQLVRPLLAEGFVVSLAGGLLGLAIAGWGLRALILAFPYSLPRAWEIGLRPWVFGFALAAVFAGTLASGLALVRLSPRKLGEALKGGGRAATGERTEAFLSGMMVTTQISISVILLAAAVLLGKGWEETQNINLGLSRQGFFFFRLSLPTVRYPEVRHRAEFFRQAVERVAALPGVAAAAASNDPPPGPHDLLDKISLQDHPATQPEEEIRAGVHFISRRYFQTLAVAVLEGREFTERDTAEAPRVMVINNKLARRFWPHSSPLGRRIQLSAITPNVWYQVIGVVADVRHGGPPADFAFETYVPLAQHSPGYITVTVRPSGDRANLLPAIKGEIQRLDAELPVFDVFTFQGYLDMWMVSRHFNSVLMHLFGGVALLLAVAGIFSLLSFRVARQTREIGVRIALGASRNQVLREILGQGMRLVLLGTVLGVAGALALSRVVSSLLVEVKLSDPFALALASVAMIVAALAACWIPARRATRVDPLIALRYE